MTALASHEVARVRFRPGVMCGLSLLLVLALLTGFFPWYSGLSSLHKNQHLQIPIRPVKADVASSLNIVIYFFLSNYFLSFTGPSAAPNIRSLFNTSSTSLFVSWLHNIPPDKYNGILIGYRVGWSEHQYMDVGLEADSFNITNLRKYWLYKVYVAGRTNGGVGDQYCKEVRTDEDGENLMIYFSFS